VRRRTTAGRKPAKMPHRKPKRPKRSCAAVTASQPNLSVSDLQERLKRQARELDEARDERAALAEELRRSEAWTAQAQRLSRTGSWVYNATTMRFLYWSEESYRIWGFDPMQGLPSRENMWQRLHPDESRQGVGRSPGGTAPEKRLHERVQNLTT